MVSAQNALLSRLILQGTATAADRALFAQCAPSRGFLGFLEVLGFLGFNHFGI